ncbi:hypothetical protein CI266_004633 [Salmonella enterica subsp. enterica serovar Kotte]|nr:hypothetical protein [Salmonella enterica subsp. enterica serovar Kotte]
MNNQPNELQEDDGKGYATYNGMGREALALGVPVIWFAFTLLFTLVATFGGMLIGGPLGGLTGVLLGGGILLYFREVCAKDSRALRKKRLELKRSFLAILKGSRVILITPLIYQRRKRTAERSFIVSATRKHLPK